MPGVALTSDPPDPDPQIRLAAHRLWLAAGRPEGAALDHWLRAEREVLSARAAEVRTAGRKEMRDPPRDWDPVDERSDESFPASDPPGTY